MPTSDTMQNITQIHGEEQRSGAVKLWSNNLTLNESMTRVLASLHDPSPDTAEILKHSRRRCVLRIHQQDHNITSLIVKGFPLEKIESRLKYKRYGLAEAHNYHQAQQLSINTPTCYGYFEQRSWGTVKSNGVLIEDLNHHHTLHDLGEQSPDQYLAILRSAIPALTELFEKGANHIDTTPHNFMQPNDGGQLVVIDWQYASFVTPRNPRQLIYQATQFLRYSKLTPDQREWSDWLRELHESCSPEQIDWDTFSTTVARLHQAKRAPNKTRLALELELG